MFNYFAIAAAGALVWACPGESAAQQQAPEIYKDSTVVRFFQRTEGWIASDGALSVALSDGRTLWLMGDSHIDDYDEATGTIPCLFQVRNAALVQAAGSWSQEQTQTLIGEGPGIKSFLKRTPDDHYWFWPGTGIQLKDTVYVYCAELEKKGEGAWGFAGTGNDMWAKLAFPEMEVVEYTSLPDFNDINFGAGYIKEGGYVYAYGYKLIPEAGGSEVYAARFPETNPDGPWEFWDGNAWSKDINQVAAIGKSAITPHVSKVKDKYLMLSTQLSVACNQGREIYASVSDRPTGPFPEQETLYTIDDTVQGHYPFFYQVVAHPQFTERDELLVTYCINGYAPCLETCPDGRANPDYYRPRGIRVPLKLIDEL